MKSNPWKVEREGKQILCRYTPTGDPVNHPAHYTQGKIEVLDFILDQNFDYLSGQVIKYVARHKHKGHPVQDLQKAAFYLNRLIVKLESTL